MSPSGSIEQTEKLQTAAGAKLTKRDRFFRAIRGERLDYPPVWIMRQAGRYMPEYRALRKRASFDDLCSNPEIAAEASLLPLDILDIDALIVFNDILVPLNAMGCRVVFAGGGPVIEGALKGGGSLNDDFRAVDYSAPGNEPVVAESIRRIREAAGPDVPVFGFAGAPFTMAAYAVEGKLTRNLDIVKRMRFEEPALLHTIMERLSETIASYLIAQVKLGGADAVQLFDTWAGQLAPACYEEFAHRYHMRVIEQVKAACPETPIFLFLRGGASELGLLAETGADVLSVDWRHSLADVRRSVGDGATLQGNLDPVALHKPERVEEHFRRSLRGFDPYRGYIANLGHGILPTTPVEGARAFVAAVRALANTPHQPVEESRS